jgi:chromate reductase
MAPHVGILGISGSLRAASRNTAALRWLATHAPAGVDLEIADISDFPLYDWDLEQEGLPASVQRVVSQVQAADAVLFATPEYNYSVTGPLKNAIDWLSRPPQSLWGKPVAMFGVAGRSGSMRSQLHLREIVLHEEVRLVMRPEVLISIGDAFDGSEFVGERAQEQLLRLLDALRAQVLHSDVKRHRVLVIGRDAAQIRRALRLLGEVKLDAVGALDDSEAVAQIESGGFHAVLVAGDVDDATRAMLDEVAMSSPDHLPCVHFVDTKVVARVALDAIHG